MGYAERHSVTVTTVTATGEGFTPVVNGRVLSIQYVKDDYSDGVDFTITGEETGQNLWTDTNVNASETVAPMQDLHTVAGAATTDPARGPVFIINERISIAIAQGGNGTSGTFHIIIGGDH